MEDPWNKFKQNFNLDVQVMNACEKSKSCSFTHSYFVHVNKAVKLSYTQLSNTVKENFGFIYQKVQTNTKLWMGFVTIQRLKTRAFFKGEILAWCCVYKSASLHVLSWGIVGQKSPEINPQRPLDFSMQQKLSKAKKKKTNPLVLKELTAKIRLEAYQALVLINKLHLWDRWGQDNSAKKKMRKGKSICSLWKQGLFEILNMFIALKLISYKNPHIE